MGTLCDLCPLDCIIEEGERGKCRVRGAKNGKIELLTWGQVSTAIAGPIEGKPLYHYRPGSSVLSLGSLGCNMFCGYCQNFEISQVGKGKANVVTPSEVIALAALHNCPGIAFTYSEPLVWYEYVFEVAQAAKEAGLFTVLKTNGFLHSVPFVKIMKYIDAINVDVKGDTKAYADVCGIELPPNPEDWSILKNLRTAMLMGKHCEVSHIVLEPLCNDFNKQDEFFSTLAYMTGKEIPIHLLKFIPDFKMRDVKPTTDEQLSSSFVTALRHFRYVYIDYAGKPINTVCDHCGTTLVKREGMIVKSNILDQDAKCPRCLTQHKFVLGDQNATI